MAVGEQVYLRLFVLSPCISLSDSTLLRNESISDTYQKPIALNLPNILKIALTRKPFELK